MSTHRLNVLVYTGTGATVESVKHCLWSLRRLLSPNYAIIPISAETLLKEPWTATCALLVMPGGADLGYCRMLNGQGNRIISQFVDRGGAYLGLCAGGYYGSARCEFELGKPAMEVSGDRELAFFPGTCRGLAFPGFVYHSELGTRAAEVKVNKDALLSAGGALPNSFRVYYNGGGVFVDAARYKDRGVQVLAEYVDKVNVDGGQGQAAVVYSKVGDGHAILTGPHPEFAAVNLRKGDENPDYDSIVAALAADDKPRIDFVKACLTKLGLKVNQDSQDPPSLSRIHLSSIDAADLVETTRQIRELATSEDGKQMIKGDADAFVIEQEGVWSLSDLERVLPTKATDGQSSEAQDSAPAVDKEQKEPRMIDYGEVTKRLVIHDKTVPESKETPYFNHHAFYANLARFDTLVKNPGCTFGHSLLYGEVVTSTNTLLEKNPSLLATLPSGLTFTATTQVAGRGRGSNVWVSPPGSLMYSTVIRHPLSLNATAPVVFIQYLAALAVLSGIKSYGAGYSALPVRLKWPNDIYALDPSLPAPAPTPSSAPLTDAQRKSHVKIGGVLISTSYTPSSDAYTLVSGTGLNLANPAPTTSLDRLAAAHGLAPFAPERLLAAILAHYEALLALFCRVGFAGPIQALYEEAWLHGGQSVVLAPEVAGGYVAGAAFGGEQRGRVRGVSADWGLLVVEETVEDGLGRERATGRTWELQSDGNSFDFFKGLVKRKEG